MIDGQPTLGSIVRHIRASKGWTLCEMSQHVGIPLSTLAKVENGHLTLSYDKLIELSRRLSMSLTDLLSACSIKRRRGMARRSIGEKDVAKDVSENCDDRYLCTELRDKMMVPIVSRVRARTMEEFGELRRSTGEEFVYVLDGAIEVHSEFYDPVTLRAGEYIYLDSEMGHGYIVAGGFDEATMLAVCAYASHQRPPHNNSPVP